MSIGIMLAAINLDDDTVLQTDEVEDVSLTRRLPPEMIPAFAPRSQVIPDLHFLRRE
jgi:hypothetical protein